jgi:hypothetical protein
VLEDTEDQASLPSGHEPTGPEREHIAVH